MKTLNLGCGERTYSEYPNGSLCVNMDTRALPNVDIIGDVENLKFQDKEFDYILASDIIEHFPISKTESLLKGWARVLNIGGIIEIRTPNLAWIAKHYAEHKDAKFASYHIMGGQDYVGNFHYVIFDIPWLTGICKNIGLEVIDSSEVGSNFIIKARRVR